ncbi:MAG: wax ester/triacylglycerol synthase family O-acyltransferase [Nevskia sp.]|nr:wax ester/triacylglycerol synthase family O-acyltransferase [Nevskia sp.]
MNLLKPLDAAWLYVESRSTPMHVAGLHVLTPPKAGRRDFVRKLVAQWRASTRFEAPWNLRLARTPFRALAPAWEVDPAIDLDYHLRHSALPQPGGERELGVLVSRLHSHPLDLTRPLWELHIIEGLEGGRFALYSKMHHALMDGVAAIRMIQRFLSVSPDDREAPAPWSVGVLHQRRAASGGTPEERLAALLDGLRGQAQALPAVARGVARIWRRDPAAGGLTAPFEAPASVLNRRITAQRRLATQQYSLARLRGLARRAGVTLNDVVLAICAGALRRFLLELDALPAQSLSAGLPVSIRAQGDDSVGTSISFILARLGTDLAGPVERLQTIHAATRSGKQHLHALPETGLSAYTAAFMAPYVMALLAGVGGRGRPMFNLTISNVPGPRRALYCAGARLEAMYPISLLTHGQALNITCVSYAGTLNFGFTGCRDTLPHMQRLAVYTGEALDELEQALAAPAG